MNDIVCASLILIGSCFMLLAGIGVIRMPDLFMRMQASTKAATLGVGCMLAAVAIHFGDAATVARAMLVAAFLLITAPIAAHMIARAAYSIGTNLWEGTIVDELREHRRAESSQTAAENARGDITPLETSPPRDKPVGS